MSAVSTRYWIGTVSREHVLTGVENGFAQVCHGKKSPLNRMQQGDWLIYYSPKMSMEGKDPCQRFTAIGQIADNNIYRFKMTDDFIPFRRDVVYLKDTQEAEIRPLLKHLSFTKDKRNWGMCFRSGMFEISQEDFKMIHNAMIYSFHLKDPEISISEPRV